MSDYLVRLRWPTGFRCPHCDARDEPWVTARNCLLCKGCRGEVSITAGTLFAGTRKSLRAWFLAIWFVTSQKHGASALGLQRVLGVGSYQTAWTWLHKMRRAMVFAGRSHRGGGGRETRTSNGAHSATAYPRRFSGADHSLHPKVNQRRRLDHYGWVARIRRRP